LNAKERRERLFKNSRPVIRRLEILDGESYSKDMSVLWAAYKAGSFSIPPGMTQEQFVAAIEQGLSDYQQSWIIDDKSKSFAAGHGQIALVGTNTTGMMVEVRPLFFKWASKRNILRASVAFLNMLRHSKKTGIVLVRTQKEKMTLPDHLKQYDLLYFLGQSDESEYLYSVRGRGNG
jgi:hypothetical protein